MPSICLQVEEDPVWQVDLVGLEAYGDYIRREAALGAGCCHIRNSLEMDEGVCCSLQTIRAFSHRHDLSLVEEAMSVDDLSEYAGFLLARMEAGDSHFQMCKVLETEHRRICSLNTLRVFTAAKKWQVREDFIQYIRCVDELQPYALILSDALDSGDDWVEMSRMLRTDFCATCVRLSGSRWCTVLQQDFRIFEC